MKPAYTLLCTPQDYGSDIYAEVDMLLTLEQYQYCVPDTQVCYLHHGSFIIFEKVTISVSSIVCESQKPLSLLKWDPLNRTLHQVGQLV